MLRLYQPEDAALSHSLANGASSEKVPADTTLDISLRSEPRYRLLFESLPLPVFLFDCETLAILDANESASRHYGYTPEEFCALSIKDLRPPEEMPAFLKSVPHLTSSVDYIGIRRHCRKDGARIDVEITSRLTSYENKPARVCIIKDVTESKQAEQALRSQTELLRSVLDGMGDGVAIVDEKGAFLLFNAAAERILQSGPTNTGPEEWVSAYGLFLPDKTTPYPITDIPLVRAMRGEAVDQAKIVVRNPRLPGEVWLSVTARPLVNENGALRGAVAVFRDITQSKQAEESLHQYTERLEILRRIDQAILSSQSLEAIAESTLGHIRHLLPCRQAGVILFDFERQECIPVATAQPTDDPHWSVGKRFPLESFGREALEALRQGKVHQFEIIQSSAPALQTIHALQTQGLCSYLEVPLMYQGQAMGSLCLGATSLGVFTPEHLVIAREVADQLAVALQQARLHERIRQANIDLERRVAERTRQLQEAAQELEAFSYSVSHDLRAPLRAIDGFSRILKEEYASELPARAQTYLRHMHENTQQMDRLINDLLDFSRLSRQMMNRQPVAPADLVREALAALAAEQSGRAVQITLGNLPDCHADRSLLKQVFINLLSNALKYTRRRETAQIEIGCLQSESSGSPSAYFVKDNGVGFDMDYAHKLFGVFQRLHAAEDFEGTGVGLAIVERILHRHDGRIWAQAEIDKGAAFYFTVEGETKS